MDVFNLVAKLTLDSSAYDSGLDESEQKASGFGSKLKTVLGGAAALGTAALGAASTAAVALTKSAVSSFASYEQLVGGVDKLYGDASGKLQAYADKAFMTAGMSANAYMETATSFSAALINSLGGDTQKAADMTDVAMRAMSDNVNVFGSSMDSVQNAFQGFAKGNYTMLDNLKLGYGGTKTEMERLIADANEYRASIGESADLSVDSFADIVQAIQSVQEAQGIAGTTNKEAMRTIEGSAAATKAAWENVITAIGRGEGLGDALSGLSSAIFGENEGEGLLNQIIPRIQTTLEGVAEFITTAGPMIAEKIPEIASAVIPSLFETSVSILQVIYDALMDGIPMLEEVGTQFFEKGVEFLTQIAGGIGDNIPVVLSTIGEVIMRMLQKLLEAAPSILSAGVRIISSLASGISRNIPTILTTAASIIIRMAAMILQNLPRILQAGLELIGQLAAGVIRGVPKLIGQIPKILQSIAKSFTSFNWGGIGSQVISGIANGIRNGIGRIASAAKDAAKSAFEAAKNFLGIKSPSRLFRDKIGAMMAKGMEIGFEQEFDPDDYADAIESIRDLGGDYSADVDRETVTIDREEDTRLIEEIRRLYDAILRLKIYLDKDEVVGIIVDPINEALGRRAVIAGRS